MRNASSRAYGIMDCCLSSVTIRPIRSCTDSCKYTLDAVGWDGGGGALLWPPTEYSARKSICDNSVDAIADSICSNLLMNLVIGQGTANSALEPKQD